MFSLPIFLIAGLVSGFCSSAPLGPINLWLVEAVIKGELKALRWFLFGVIVVDLIFAVVAIWGYYKFLEDSPFLLPIQVGAGFFLIAIGLFGLIKLRKKDGTSDLSDTMGKPVGGVFHHIIYGMTICGSNPGFLMFWLFVVNFMNDSLDLSFSLHGNVLFVVGVALGDWLWFRLLIWVVKKGLNLAKPKFLLVIRYLISFTFLSFGILTIWRSLA